MTDNPGLLEALRAVGRSLVLVEKDGRWTVGDGLSTPGDRTAFVPACRLEDLGDASFRADHRLRYAYVAGAMANGIGSVEIVEAMSRAGMLGFFGAAGLPLARVEAAIDRLSRSLGDAPYGFNLIHSPNEPDLENAVVDLYLRRGVRLVEASAYLDLTLAARPLPHCTASTPTPPAGVVTPNRVIAKVSRVEVASKFFAPPPDRHAARAGAHRRPDAGAGRGWRRASRWPRTSPPRPTPAATPTTGRWSRCCRRCWPCATGCRRSTVMQIPLRVGAAGGIATPASAAAAFVMGAAYVLTGSVNQACVESGSSDAVREMLAQAEQADVIMAPAADMFEMGVKVQVLKRGTMFAMRAAKLYELYRAHARLEDLPAAERAALEKNLFRAPLEEIWAQTRALFPGARPAPGGACRTRAET